MESSSYARLADQTQQAKPHHPELVPELAPAIGEQALFELSGSGPYCWQLVTGEGECLGHGGLTSKDLQRVWHTIIFTRLRAALRAGFSVASSAESYCWMLKTGPLELARGEPCETEAAAHEGLDRFIEHARQARIWDRTASGEGGLRLVR